MQGLDETVFLHVENGRMPFVLFFTPYVRAFAVVLALVLIAAAVVTMWQLMRSHVRAR